jgi:alpha,alpha-trehalose phosphorylase
LKQGAVERRHPTPSDAGWCVRIRGDGPGGSAAQAETLLALANGCLGVRGGREEQASPTDGALLAGIYERVPIHYHEGFRGFARHSDTRVPVIDGKRIRVHVGAAGQDLAGGERLDCERTLDLRAGLLLRTTRWRLPGAGTFEVQSTRLVALGGGPLLALRFTLRSIDFTGPVRLESALEAGQAARRVDDPRFGADERAVLVLGARGSHGDAVTWAQHAERTGLHAVACQLHAGLPPAAKAAAAADEGRALVQSFEAQLVPGAELTIDKFVAWADGRDPAPLAALAVQRAQQAAKDGFDALVERQRAAWQRFWDGAELGIDGDASLQEAVRFNLFHLRQSAPDDGRQGLPAKGLTGQGYEGHVFWDTEAFALPVLQMTAPRLVRASLDWRAATLERARLHAREMNHDHGALYPWRTIAGDEGSAYFPSGSAQYHINAAIAFALRFHVLGSGDGRLAERDAAMLFETARLWMQAGHFSRGRGGRFCIHAVTGPDEYSALVDNDHYTNRMAQLHLRFAAAQAAGMAAADPEAWSALRARLSLADSEPDTWARAAEAMYLPVDAATGVVPQDDSFLQRPLWDRGANADGPLLLDYHPLTLYRHQVCKQPSVVLADVLAGHDVAPAQKLRNFLYYEARTVHDSSLSASTWAIMAAELGLHDRSVRYLREGARLDLDDLHGNASHGAHMAAMAGSWLSLTWGIGGLRVRDDGQLSFAPRLPPAWAGCHFTLQWRGSTLRAELAQGSTRFSLLAGPPLDVLVDGTALRVGGGAPAVAATAPLRAPSLARHVQAVAFDLDGVLADTAELHFQAWGRLAGELGIPFDRAFNESLKGVDRAASLGLILGRGGRVADAGERERLAARKNGYFLELVAALTPSALLPGALELLRRLRAEGVRVALASASRNAPEILARLGIADCFDVIADPSRGAPKPAPDQFLAAAAALGVAPARCLGVEDAVAGIRAIRAAGMYAIGIGHPLVLAEADLVVPDLASLGIERLLAQCAVDDGPPPENRPA